jgi:pilus assembly protein CpaF
MFDLRVVAVSVGAGISFMAAGVLVYKILKKTLAAIRIAREEKRASELLKKVPFDEWVHTLERSIRQSNLKINAGLYIAASLLASVAAFFFSLAFLKNLTASIFLALAFLVIPEHILNILIQRKREKTKEQMVAAIRIFTAEYLQTPQLEKALDAVGRRVADPVGGAFRRAYTELMLGKNADMVLAGLARNINNEYGIMFVQLLKLSLHDASISSLFAELLERIESNIELSRKNHANLTGERVLALMMTCIPIPAYFLMSRIIPETTHFLAETFIGRTIITIAFGSIFIWALLDRIMGRVEA